MKGTGRLGIIVLVMLVAVALVPTAVLAAKTPGKAKISKVAVSGQTMTVKWGKVKYAKKYKVCSVTYKNGWKYWKSVKANKKNKKKYKDTTKYKLKKNGSKYKVYKKTKKPSYKALKTVKKKTTSVSIKGKYATRYNLAVRAYNGKKAGKYSSVKSVYIKPDYDAYETYVFFGSDSRADDDAWKSKDGGKTITDTSGTQELTRSDVIMLLNVNKSSRKIDMVSIYRDTYMDISGNGTDFEKINKAYSDFGPYGAMDALEKDLDIRIKGYVSTNFKGVADAIDVLAPEGIEIDVEADSLVEPYRSEKFADYSNPTVKDVVNKLIDETNLVYGDDVSHLTKSGKQKLNGAQAVAYSRVRYTEGSDMMRTKRQQAVLTAMSAAFRNAGTDKRTEVIRSIYPTLDTDIDEQEYEALFTAFGTYGIGKQVGFPFFTSSAEVSTSEGKVWVMVPCDLETNVTRLHSVIYGEGGYQPSGTVEKLSRKIMKNTKLGYAERNTSYDNY